MSPSRLTSLYRSPLPTRFAMTWAWLATCIVLVSAWASHGMHSGIRGAAAVFFGWAITRELAPSRPLPSLFAPFLAVAFAIPEHTDILACGAVLVLARILARTVGGSLTWFDQIALVAFAGWVATRPVGLPVALVLAAAIFVERPTWRSRAFGAVALATAIVAGSVEGTLTVRGGWSDASTERWILLALLVCGAARLLFTRLPARVRVRDDRQLAWLRGIDVRISRVAVVAAVAAASLWTNTDAIFHLSAACAAIVAVGLGGVKLRVRRNPAVHVAPSSHSSASG